MPAAEGRLLAYQTVDGATPGEVAALADDASGVEEVRPLGDGGGDRIECSADRGSLLVPLVERGVSLRSAAVEDGVADLRVEVPADADVRDILDRVTAAYERTTLAAKRDRPTGDRDGTDDAFDLTERQRESLEAALRAGYFEWPRDSTAEEVADAMDVSPPTLHNHLRKAEKELVESYFSAAEDED